MIPGVSSTKSLDSAWIEKSNFVNSELISDYGFKNETEFLPKYTDQEAEAGKGPLKFPMASAAPGSPPRQASVFKEPPSYERAITAAATLQATLFRGTAVPAAGPPAASGAHGVHVGADQNVRDSGGWSIPGAGPLLVF